jgi:AAA ATPase domain
MAGAPSQVGVVTRLPGGQLVGRQREREVLDKLLAAARDREPGVLVVHGQPGVGKTALLEWAIEAAPDFRVVRAAGVEADMELAFAALQQLCAPIIELMERLPQPQRDALAVAFGLAAGQAPNPFLVGLAVLGLLSEAAEERALLCVVDDAQWLDGASARALAFVARRLLAEKIAVLFATRDLGDAIARLPELRVEPLGHRDARLLLESALPARLDDRVLERVVVETRGNPLALLELPRGLTPAQLAGGFGLPVAVPLSASIEESYRRRLARLPHDARRLLLIAAADPVGDPALIWRAAKRLGIPETAADAAESEGFLTLGAARVVFRHPLVRSAVHGASGLRERREIRPAESRPRGGARRPLTCRASWPSPWTPTCAPTWRRRCVTSPPSSAPRRRMASAGPRSGSHGACATTAARRGSRRSARTERTGGRWGCCARWRERPL